MDSIFSKRGEMKVEVEYIEKVGDILDAMK
jgi:hypothetical protein